MRGITQSVATLLAAGGTRQETREVEAPWVEPEDQAEAIELPQDIRERIRADAASDEQIEPPTRPSEEAEPAGEESPEPTSTGRLDRKLAGIPSVEPVDVAAPMAHSGQPKQPEADVDDLADILVEPSKPLIGGSATASEPAERLADSDRPTLRMAAEPAEAKVTFVRRAAQSAAAREPSGSEGEPQATAAGDTFVPAVAGAEEAEVTIVKPEDPATVRTRRFRKALSGD
jgi:hypothetical protein